MSRLWVLFLLGGFILVTGCGNNSTSTPSDPDAKATQGPSGFSIYTTNCLVCHGSDGSLGLSGAFDLSKSALTLDERIEVITNGRRTMQSWKGRLSAEEIAKVAEYTIGLKKN